MDFTDAQLTLLQQKTRATESESRSALLQASSWEEALRLLVAHLEPLKPPESVTNEGGVFSYIHDDRRIGVLLELQCVSATVARSEPFRRFAHTLVRQIAITAPRYVTSREMPVSERRMLISSVLRSNLLPSLPQDQRDVAIRAEIDEKFAELVLLMQPWQENPALTLADTLQQIIAVTGEKIVVSRFVRFSLYDT